jgi:hypothetical protein
MGERNILDDAEALRRALPSAAAPNRALARPERSSLAAYNLVRIRNLAEATGRPTAHVPSPRWRADPPR